MGFHIRFAGQIPRALLVVALLPGILGSCGSDSSDSANPEDLYGIWLSSRGQTWEISEGSIAVTDGAVDGFTYTVADDTIVLTDKPGPIACGPSQTGTYEWAIEDEVLSLDVVNDSCQGRKSALDGFTLERTE